MISKKEWDNYITKLRKINEVAAEKMQWYVDTIGIEDRNALIDYAYAVVTKYGEASTELACQMYDLTAEIEGKIIESALPAPTATYQETAIAINGSLLQSPSGQKIAQTASRLVKQAGQDTTLQNSVRDGAYFAWVPSGDTCAFCITLASRGFQRISKKALKNGHAEHIHANCDCAYSISFNQDAKVGGYDPDKYREMYYSQDGKPKDKINALRRENYAKNKDKINEQKRIAYAKRKESENIDDFSKSLVSDTLYHGTDVDNIKQFNLLGKESNGAIFVADDIDYAEEEAIVKNERTGNGRVIYETKINIQNPLEVTLPPNEFSDPTVEAKYIKFAKEQGKDSVIFHNDTDEEWLKQTFYAVFDPKRVKIIGKQLV